MQTDLLLCQEWDVQIKSMENQRLLTGLLLCQEMRYLHFAHLLIVQVPQITDQFYIYKKDEYQLNIDLIFH